MSYVKHILFSGEQVLYDGHVHPVVMARGAIWLGLAAWILMESYHPGGTSSLLLRFSYWLAGIFPSTGGLYRTFSGWQQTNPHISVEMKIIGFAVAAWGFSKLMRGLVMMQSTELVVTDRRIICKVGIMTVLTQEMDRGRVAGVTVHQTLMGRILGYGHIHIQGFTTSIGGLPVMVNPHMVERFVNV